MYSFVIAALAALAIAAPAPAPSASSSTSTCMSSADANKVAQTFQTLINQKFNFQLARDSIALGFQDFSDSVSELINQACSTGPKTLGQVTFGSREAFIHAQSGQDPIPFEILNVWNNCDTVTMRWRSNTPASVVPSPQLVTGIVVIETTPNPDTSSDQPFQMKTVYSEFNSGAWLIDTHNATSTAACSATKMRRNLPVHPAFNGRARIF